MALIEKMTTDIQQKGGLIVSCQPVDNSPMDKPEIVAAMAQAAVNAGAVAVRIEGIDNLKATRPLIDVPIIGIVKRDLLDSPVRITPWLSDVEALATEGADIIALMVRIVYAQFQSMSYWLAYTTSIGWQWQIVPHLMRECIARN